jgi:hypothetical protein
MKNTELLLSGEILFLVGFILWMVLMPLTYGFYLGWTGKEPKRTVMILTGCIPISGWAIMSGGMIMGMHHKRKLQEKK